MSTLEKAIGLLQEMPENKLEAVYMYMCFVNSQTDDEIIPAPKERIDSLMGIVHKYAKPTLMEKEATAFQNAVAEKSIQKNSTEERQRGFQGLMSFAGTLPKDFDYNKELAEARDEKYARFI